MSPGKWLVIFVLLAFLLPGFKSFAGAAAMCAVHHNKCTATCKEKKTCHLNKHTCKTAHGKVMHKKAETSGRSYPSYKSCRHETSPVSLLSVKELPGKRFFSSMHLAPIPGDFLIVEKNLYEDHRPLLPEKPPQRRLS